MTNSSTPTRPTLSLYTLDRPALVAVSKELRELLTDDDRVGLGKMLGLGAALAQRLASGKRAVDWFLRPDDDPEAGPFFASLRRITKQRALSLAWKSSEPSLEGRLRQFDLLREDHGISERIDKLLDSSRLPWFLCRPGATSGWLDAEPRALLASDLEALAPALPNELKEFVVALADIDGAIVAHDGM